MGIRPEQVPHDLPVRGIVLDVEQCATSHVGAHAGRNWIVELFILRFQLGRSRGHHFEPEDAAFAYLAFDAENSIHQFREALGHHQSNAGAGDAPVFLPQPIERLEELRQFFPELSQRQSL